MKCINWFIKPRGNQLEVVHSLIFNSVFLSAGRLTSGIFTDYFCHKKCGLSHFFFSLIYMFWKKNDSSLILKYISRKTKEVFWKLGRKNLNHWQEWKDAGLLFIWSKNFVDRAQCKYPGLCLFYERDDEIFRSVKTHINSKRVCVLLSHFCKISKQKVHEKSERLLGVLISV